MSLQPSHVGPAARILVCLGAGALLAPLVVAFGVDPLSRELTLKNGSRGGLSLVLDLARLEGRVQLWVGGVAP